MPPYQTTPVRPPTSQPECSNRTPTRNTVGCPRCEARWGGLKTAHCAACHNTFTTVGNFDRHRTGDHSKSTRHCLPPTDVGLIDAGRDDPCWGMPGRGARGVVVP